MVRLRRLRPPSCRPSISSLVSSLAANAARSTCFRVLNSMLTMIARKILMPTSAIRAREAITNAGQRQCGQCCCCETVSQSVISRSRPALPSTGSQSCCETHNARARALRAPKHEGRDNTAAVQHSARARAHTLRTPKHRSHYHYGRRCGRHDPYIHRPLIGKMREKRRRRS